MPRLGGEGIIRQGSRRKTGHMYIKCLVVRYLLRCTCRTVTPVGVAVRMIHVNVETDEKLEMLKTMMMTTT